MNHFSSKMDAYGAWSAEKIWHSSYYKVVVFIDPLQGLYAIILEILWIVFTLLPLDGLRKATTTVSLYIC